MSKISDLKFDDKNFNKHSARGMGLLEKSLQQYGGGRSILIDKDNNIIAGNGIIEAAGNVGLEDLQIVESDGTKIIAVKRTDIDINSQQGREMALADNATSAADLAWDDEAIAAASEEFGFDPGDWLSDWNNEIEAIEEDEPPEVNESEPAKSELGKVYQLGNHRLMCGDSTDAGSVAILMDGQKADMVFTDPPYGVSYTGGQFYSGKPIKNRREQILNDKNLIYDISLQTILDYIDDGAFYVCYASLYSIEVLTQLRNIGLEQRAIIIWNKTNTGYGDLNSNYKNNYEPIFYGVKKGKRANFVGDTTQTTVWSIDKPKSNDLHPTTKPTELCAKAIVNSSCPEEIVVDLFGGSGSTLIACEQLGRKCYMMELDPKYCDVIRKRYWKFTHDGNEEGWEEGTPAI